ncbi:MAG: TIGR03769 domain-containing protein [Cytophagales bacterium]|nr:TIGR03769 domain-containing protein [Armatimonadota bacterium]
MNFLTRRSALLTLPLLLASAAIAAPDSAPPATGEDEGPAPSEIRHRAPWHQNRRLAPQQDRSFPRTTLETSAELGAAYTGGTWEHFIADLTTDTEYAPWQAVLKVAPAAKVARPAGTQFDFLGVPAGETISILPQFQRAGLLYLAVSNEDQVGGTFSSYDVTTESGGRVKGTAPWVKWRLLAVKGPGAFSAYTLGSFGKVTTWFSNADGIDQNDAVWVKEREDLHLNWAFTKPGFYRVVAVVSAYLPGQTQPVYSRPVIYRFSVEP